MEAQLAASSRGATAWAAHQAWSPSRVIGSRPRHHCPQGLEHGGRWAAVSNQAPRWGAALAPPGPERLVCSRKALGCQVGPKRWRAPRAPQILQMVRARGSWLIAGLVFGAPGGFALQQAHQPKPQKSAWSSSALKGERSQENTSEAVAAGMAGAKRSRAAAALEQGPPLEGEGPLLVERHSTQ